MLPHQFSGLVERFLGLPMAVLGRGPEHHTDPQPELSAEIERFLAEFPFLRQYSDYVLFLKQFAGASAAGALLEGPGIGDPDYLFVSVYGFEEANPRFLERASFDAIDSRGFYGFCETGYRYKPDRGDLPPTVGVLAAEFCLDATGEREPGIYVECIVDGSREPGTGELVKFCDSFTQWFQLLVDHQGRIPTMKWVLEYYSDKL